MKSIRDIYKIGKGPSSSHTMGPERAAKLFKAQYPRADAYRVILFGSLSKTGVGHGTDRVVKEVLSPAPTEVVFSQEVLENAHPNTMDLIALKDGQKIGELRIESIGGGDIRIPGQPGAAESPEVYPEQTFSEVANFCKWNYIKTLSDYVEDYEGPEIWDFLRQVWDAMKQAIDEGLHAEGILPGGLGVRKRAKYLYSQELPTEVPQVRECRIISAYAFAVSEQNADNGTVVTAPTCGACGVLPAVLKYVQETRNLSDDQILRGLATAGIIGNLTKKNASVSGAECGCQAEIGTACAMSAAALAELYGLSLEQVEYAAEIAMEHHLGLTCDPICGLVQIPCIERNAVAAARAIDSATFAILSDGKHRVNFDHVVAVMKETGHNLPSLYRETAEGGLAKHYRSQK